MIRELNQVIDYIEAHLTEELTLENIANYAGVSDYHFRRIFYYLTGTTLYEYIRQRRLSEAGMALLRGVSVTDVAFTYGYQSLEGFSRAYKQFSGNLPSEVIKNGKCTSYPTLTFTISVQGGKHMEFRIEKKPAFNLVGVSKRVPMQFEGVNQEIVKLAQSITARQREKMHTLQNIEPYEVVNASYEADAKFMKEEGYLTHLIGVLTTEEETGASLEKVSVASHTWVVFPFNGPFPDSLQKTMASIYAQWLPSSHYELVNAPTFSFTKMSEAQSDYASGEIWIAVKEI
jgi:AraC family transcriptional regulator